MTKKKAAWASRDAWTAALAEGRVLRFPDFDRLTSYPTIAMRDKAIAEAVAEKTVVEIVQVPAVFI
jgi:hypothetical protein